MGGRTLTIQDIVTNDGAQSTPHALLYHINLGYPAVSDGTEVHLGERRVMGPLTLPDFDPQPEAASIPVALGETASCQLTTPAPEGPAFRLDLSFSARTLPYLQLWRDLRPHAGVVALEPCTSAREAGGASGSSRTIGARRSKTLPLGPRLWRNRPHPAILLHVPRRSNERRPIVALVGSVTSTTSSPWV